MWSMMVTRGTTVGVIGMIGMVLHGRTGMVTVMLMLMIVVTAVMVSVMIVIWFRVTNLFGDGMDPEMFAIRHLLGMNPLTF